MKTVSLHSGQANLNFYTKWIQSDLKPINGLNWSTSIVVILYICTADTNKRQCQNRIWSFGDVLLAKNYTTSFKFPNPFLTFCLLFMFEFAFPKNNARLINRLSSHWKADLVCNFKWFKTTGVVKKKSLRQVSHATRDFLT